MKKKHCCMNFFQRSFFAFLALVYMHVCLCVFMLTPLCVQLDPGNVSLYGTCNGTDHASTIVLVFGRNVEVHRLGELPSPSNNTLLLYMGALRAGIGVQSKSQMRTPPFHWTFWTCHPVFFPTYSHP